MRPLEGTKVVSLAHEIDEIATSFCTWPLAGLDYAASQIEASYTTGAI